MSKISPPRSAPDPVAALLDARLSGHALPAFPAPVPTTLAEAYAIQRRLIAALDAPVLGWKVGRIPPPLIAALGAERVAGPVLRIAELDGVVAGDAAIFRGGAGAIEAEVMLRLRAVPDGRVTGSDDGAAWIDDVRAGFEIASSPAPDVHDHAPYGIIADIGINNGLLLGPSLDFADFQTLTVETQVERVTVGTGRAIDVLDGPWGSLNFLVDLHRRGVIELKPGQWISAGAITGVHPIVIGQTATARFGAATDIACIAVTETGFRK
ncbi:2-keto-4-pentenoate hydratase [Sphingopyxis sp. YR583]|jgi:2-keto-4-pentenoate hydratase|uniref:2-keto-4-pentenoate hydratase n=1 Tax=Sphingopyxis sp. YR583 TaxID=1881047 RepID=UPI0008A8104A|nr:2-keto-4-pentenoate hydratase [Sphingopyxis sp. YR583]SEH19331.1 2-keto-4-pentenoate hydratase [Sphingopyxis sp. YR583]